ncbi:MAG: hypothetical protein K6G25_11310 [Bacteroidales bacterium]|nr:hypothetical protein [Bacteroidales bacterium]
MENKKVNKTEFVEMASAIGTVTYQIVSNGNVWFEQLTDDKAMYQHRLLSIKRMKSDALFNKALVEAHKEPSRMKDSMGNVCAFIYESNSFVYYSLVPVTRREKAYAERQVRLYARCLASKKATRLPHQPNENKLAA